MQREEHKALVLPIDDGSLTVQLMKLIQEMQVELRDHISRSEDDMLRHSSWVNDVNHKLTQLCKAFPDGTEKHAMHHKLWDDEAAASVNFWREMRLTVAKWGVVSIVGFVLLCIAFFIFHDIPTRLNEWFLHK